ncbi:MAG TPA: MATE family efflux transporter [Caldimonas sp.]|jgi:MATE family multidrug resistance protein|nr:MATE family efflux transporter [Caldimonas sp.]HEX2542092.1 MATE family efflux transporter [Caldimonas sp.]
MTRPSLAASARRIAPLAWPVFVGQLAVLAFSTVDTVMVARTTRIDLAALAIGGSVYISVFVGFMGIVLAIGPIAGQLYGAGKLRESGRATEQAVWLALALAVPGCALLLFPEPFLALARAEPDVAAKVRDYLRGLAFALPAALVFTAYRGFNIAVSRPKAVMALQIGALGLKVPLNALLVFGATLPLPFGELRLPALGAAGCGMATAIVMAVQLLAAWVLLRRDAFYEPFGLGRHLSRPDPARIGALLRLGVPMGLAIVVEVTGFTFMAFFVSRIGATAVAGHQVAVNMVSMMFMLPLAIANATSTLVAQRVGADDVRDARQIGWAGLEIGILIAAALGGAVYLLRGIVVELYTSNPVIVAAAVPLLAWVALFHVADAAQTIAAFVLRAYRIATVPLIVYVLAIWGVGLGGGYVVAFDLAGIGPPSWMRAAQGFWSMATLGLTVAAIGMTAFLAWTLRRQRRAEVASLAAGA